MNKLKRALLWLALVLIILLIITSIYGAFVGAERAQKFFNSTPLATYWVVLGLVLFFGFAGFRRLVRVPALLMIHAGCILVLLGGVWGSQTGHKMQKKYFGIDKIRTGRMAIYEGDNENRVILENSRLIEELPFSVKLNDFRMEFYEPEYLYIQTRRGDSWRVLVVLGAEFDLGQEYGTVKILRKFENFKITVEAEKREITDNPQAGYNPALEVQFTSPDGQVSNQYVFERLPGHSHMEDKFVLSYQRTISEYISELEVIKDGKVVAKKDIEVNHPLHYGGYHFYQQDYDHNAARYTVLGVVSDSGVDMVFAGYWMLCLGIFWHMWFRQKGKKKEIKIEINGT